MVLVPPEFNGYEFSSISSGQLIQQSHGHLSHRWENQSLKRWDSL